MQFQIDVKRFVLVFPILLLVQTLLQFYMQRVYMLQFYLRLSPLFYTAHEVSLPLLFFSALSQVFLFLVLYAQSASVFPRLRGGLLFGLILGIVFFLPSALLQMATVSASGLQLVFGHWLYIDFVSKLILGAICGILYIPKASEHADSQSTPKPT